jgi:hypothetical protein
MLRQVNFFAQAFWILPKVAMRFALRLNVPLRTGPIRISGIDPNRRFIPLG